MGFGLEIFDDIELDQRSRALALRLGKRLKKEKMDEKEKKWFKVLIGDLTALKSWGILQCIDGYNAGNKRFVIRMVLERLSGDEVQEAYNIAVNAAISTERDWAPGYGSGHSILFEAVATNLDSRFYDTINPELFIRLVNGRLWENLALRDTHNYLPVEESLIRDFEDLRMGFVPNGLHILERNSRRMMYPNFLIGGLEEDRHVLSKRAIDNYLRFIKEIDKNSVRLGIEQTRLVRLVNAYIQTLNAVYDGDPSFPIFHDKKERLGDPFIQKWCDYLKKNPIEAT